MRRTFLPTSMAILFFIGKSLARQSSGPPSITSTICLFGGRLGAGWGTSSPSVTQLSFQFVNFTLHVSVILCMGDMALPSRLAFASMSCAYTSFTALSPFEDPVRIAMLGTPWFCLVWVNIYLVQPRCCLVWTCFLHCERSNRISFGLDQALSTDGANCKDWNCIGPKTGLGSNTNGPNNKFVERG